MERVRDSLVSGDPFLSDREWQDLCVAAQLREPISPLPSVLLELLTSSTHSSCMTGVRPAVLQAEVCSRQAARLEWQQLPMGVEATCVISGSRFEARQQHALAVRVIHVDGSSTTWFPVHVNYKGAVVAWYVLSHWHTYTHRYLQDVHNDWQQCQAALAPTLTQAALTLYYFAQT